MAQLVRALSQYTKVVNLIPGQGTHKNQLMVSWLVWLSGLSGPVNRNVTGSIPLSGHMPELQARSQVGGL